MSSLDKITQPTIGSLLIAQNQIAAILSNYPCNATTSGSYGHASLIYSDTVWLTKDGITEPVVINKPATFAGTSYASRYVYKDTLKIYEDKIKHQKGAIRMIKYIFPEPVFLDLCDNQGQLVGQTPKQIIKHLQDTFCNDEENKEEILKQYKIMNLKYDPQLNLCKFILKHYKMLAPFSRPSTKQSPTRSSSDKGSTNATNTWT
jgi:hypothetical protein